MVPPSVLAHGLNGGILLAALLFLIVYFPKLRALDEYRMLVLILLFSIVIGIHGVSHALLERQYQYVPFNLWTLPKRTMDCPCMRSRSSKMDLHHSNERKVVPVV